MRNFTLFIQSAPGNQEVAQKLMALRLKARPWDNQQYYRVVFAYYRRAQDIDVQ